MSCVILAIGRIPGSKCVSCDVLDCWILFWSYSFLLELNAGLEFSRWKRWAYLCPEAKGGEYSGMNGISRA